MPSTSKTTEITLYLRGGHEVHLGTTGPDDEAIPQMRADLVTRWRTGADGGLGVMELLDSTIVRADDVVAMSVDDVEYVPHPSGVGVQRILAGDYGY